MDGMFFWYISLVYFCRLFPLPLAWLFDRWQGDPSWLPHPVVGFGKLIAWGEKCLNAGRARVWKGGMMSVALIVGVYFFTFLFFKVIGEYSIILTALIQTLLIFCCLAGTTLIREVRMVFEAVDRSLDEGRKQVARIVGRDTSALSAQEVRTAALETLAENLSDGVIAPLFWYAVLGVPGMMAYKMVNTLDSMIGYRNERYRQFGCIAARIDDVANYIPARLTALLMILVSGRFSLLRFVGKYGSRYSELPFRRAPLLFRRRGVEAFYRQQRTGIDNRGYEESRLCQSAGRGTDGCVGVADYSSVFELSCSRTTPP